MDAMDDHDSTISVDVNLNETSHSSCVFEHTDTDHSGYSHMRSCTYYFPLLFICSTIALIEILYPFHSVTSSCQPPVLFPHHHQQYQQQQSQSQQPYRHTTTHTRHLDAAATDHDDVHR